MIQVYPASTANPINIRLRSDFTNPFIQFSPVNYPLAAPSGRIKEGFSLTSISI